MNKIRTTVYIEQSVLKQFKMLCINKNKNASEWINELMKNEIEKGEKENETNNS